MINVDKFVVGPLETNCYLVYDGALAAGFLIDPGFFDKRISSAIAKKGIRVKNIINTHGHFDHTSGNKEFGYPVLIHKADGGTLKDGDVIKEGSITLEVMHTPGHTPGGISLKMGDKVFTGDTLFSEGVGRTDFPYSNGEGLLDAIREKLMTLDDETEVLPGHGPASTIGHERKHNPFLQ